MVTMHDDVDVEVDVNLDKDSDGGVAAYWRFRAR